MGDYLIASVIYKFFICSILHPLCYNGLRMLHAGNLSEGNAAIAYYVLCHGEAQNDGKLYTRAQVQGMIDAGKINYICCPGDESWSKSEDKGFRPHTTDTLETLTSPSGKKIRTVVLRVNGHKRKCFLAKDVMGLAKRDSRTLRRVVEGRLIARLERAQTRSMKGKAKASYNFKSPAEKQQNKRGAKRRAEAIIREAPFPDARGRQRPMKFITHEGLKMVVSNSKACTEDKQWVEEILAQHKRDEDAKSRAFLLAVFGS